MIAIGDVEWVAMGTPRGRLGAILFGDERGSAARGRRPLAPSGGAAGRRALDQIGEALAAFAPKGAA